MKIFLVCGVADDAERNQAMLLFRELSARGNDVTLLGKSLFSKFIQFGFISVVIIVSI